MLTRLRGLFLIGNFLLPILVLLYVVTLYLSYKGDVEEAWSTQVKPQLLALEQSADNINTLVDGVVQKGDEVAKKGKVLLKRADGTLTLAGVGDKIKNLEVPSVDVGTKDVNIKFTKSISRDVTVPTVDVSIVKPFSKALKALEVLTKMPEEAQKVQAALGILATSVMNLSGTVGGVLATIGNFSLFLLVWFGVQRFLRGTQELAQGWRMLTLGDAYQQV